MKEFWAIFVAFVSDIAVFVLKRELQLTNLCGIKGSHFSGECFVTIPCTFVCCVIDPKPNFF